jgi:hypothetical protein
MAAAVGERGRFVKSISSPILSNSCCKAVIKNKKTD